MGGLYNGVSLFRFQKFFRFCLVFQHAIPAGHSRFPEFVQRASLAWQEDSFIPCLAAKPVPCSQQFFCCHYTNRYSQQNLTSAAGTRNITATHSANPSNSNRIPSVFTNPSIFFFPPTILIHRPTHPIRVRVDVQTVQCGAHRPTVQRSGAGPRPALRCAPVSEIRLLDAPHGF